MSKLNWKKVTSYKCAETWQRQNEEDENMFITLFRQDYDPSAWGFEKPRDYPVTIGGCSNTEIRKVFATEEEAMAFVDFYMEEN